MEFKLRQIVIDTLKSHIPLDQRFVAKTRSPEVLSIPNISPKDMNDYLK